MYVEVLKRLGVANVHVLNNNNDTKNLILPLEKSQIVLHIENCVLSIIVNNSTSQSIKISYAWPIDSKEFGDPIDCMYKATPENDDLLFRISLKNNNTHIKRCEDVAFLPHSALFGSSSNQAIASTHLACFPKDYEISGKTIKKNGEATSVPEKLTVYCASCKTNSFSMECIRLLPLPSINWKESSNDWFCGCTHVSKHSRMAREEDEGQKVCNNDENNECTISLNDNATNRRLATASLNPQLGDVLYSKAFLCLSSNSLEKSHLKKVPGCSHILNCSFCNAELGFNDNDTYTFWDHALCVTVNTSPVVWKQRNPLITIKKLIDTVYEESGKPFMQVELYESGEQKRSIFLQILERYLCLLVPEDNTQNKTNQLQEKSVMKVLFTECYIEKERKNNANTISVKIGSDMIDAALTELNTNSLMIPYSQRFQKGEYGRDLIFSYIFNVK